MNEKEIKAGDTVWLLEKPKHFQNSNMDKIFGPTKVLKVTKKQLVIKARYNLVRRFSKDAVSREIFTTRKEAITELRDELMTASIELEKQVRVIDRDIAQCTDIIKADQAEKEETDGRKE